MSMGINNGMPGARVAPVTAIGTSGVTDENAPELSKRLSLEDQGLSTIQALNVTADTQDIRHVVAMLQETGDGLDGDTTVNIPTSRWHEEETIRMPSGLLLTGAQTSAGKGSPAARPVEGDENVDINEALSDHCSASKHRSMIDQSVRGPLRTLNVVAHSGLADQSKKSRAQEAILGGKGDLIINKQSGSEVPSPRRGASNTVSKLSCQDGSIQTSGDRSRPSAEELARRRETADPESLRYLLTLLRSPGGSVQGSQNSLSVSPGKAIEKILGPTLAAEDERGQDGDEGGGDSSTRATGAEAGEEEATAAQRQKRCVETNITVDTLHLERLIVDLETSLGGGTPAVADSTTDSFISPIARRRSSIMARRLTADPGLLEDLIHELTGGKGRRLSTVARSPASVVMTTLSTTRTSMAAAVCEVPTLAATDSRRATASPGDIGMLLAELPSDQGGQGGEGRRPSGRTWLDTGEQAETGASCSSYSMSPPPLPSQGSNRKLLRSCLSSKKERPTQPSPASPGPSFSGSATKKSVVFGSPNAAYFHKSSPSNSLTPMTKRDVERIFPQHEESLGQAAVEMETGVTAENTAILAEWNDKDAGENGDEDESEEAAIRDQASEDAAFGKRKRVSKSPRPKRRQSLMLAAGSPGFMQYRHGPGATTRTDDEEGDPANRAVVADVEDMDSIGGNSLNEKLEEAEEEDFAAAAGQDQADGSVASGEASPAPTSTSLRRRRSSGLSILSQDEEMPDLENRSSSPDNFRTLDQRTSSQLGIMGATESLDMGDGAKGNDKEECTVELEQDLRSLVKNVRPASVPAAGIMAPEDNTMELEGNLQALMQHVGEKVTREGQSASSDRNKRVANLDIGLGGVDSDVEEGMSQSQDLTNTTTFHNKGEDIRLSFDSEDNSFHGADATNTSILDNPPHSHAFSLSFTGNAGGEDEDEDTDDKAVAGGARLTDLKSTTFDVDPLREEEADEDQSSGRRSGCPGDFERRSVVQKSTDSHPASPESAAGNINGGDGDTTSSPFAHIVVGNRLHVPVSVQEDQSVSCPSSHPPPLDAVQSQPQEGAFTLLSKPYPYPSPARGAQDDNLAPQTEDAAGEAGCCGALDWKGVMAFQNDRSNIMRLVRTATVEEANRGSESSSSDECHVATLTAHLQRVARETLLENCERVAINLYRCKQDESGIEMAQEDQEQKNPGVEFDVPDTEALRQEMLAISTASGKDQEEGQSIQVNALIRAVAPRLQLEWRSVENQILQMVRMRVRQEMEDVDEKGSRLKLDLDNVSSVQTEIQAAISTARDKFEHMQAQRKDTIRQLRLKELKTEHQEAVEEAAALEARERVLKEALVAEQESLQSRNAKRQMAARLRAAVEEKRKEAEIVLGVEEQGKVLRGLHLWQPSVLTSEELLFWCAHPDNSRTQVRMRLEAKKRDSIHKVFVTAVHVNHAASAPSRVSRNTPEELAFGPNSRELLLHVLRSFPIFASTEPPEPFVSAINEPLPGKRSRSFLSQSQRTWSWEVLSVDMTEVPAALARLERLVGRAHLLMEAVARVEAIHPCTLVLGESAIRSESWVEECLYGACTTCRFDHGRSGASGEPHIRLPHCSGILVANLEPSSKRGGSPLVAKFLLSLSFLASVPVRVEPPLPSSKRGCLQKLEGLLTNRLGVPPHRPISIQGHQKWRAATMMVEACRLLGGEGGL
ncbi:hypothetical protein Naga_100007g74 [Nannochloropsis gaditana]|uniref:Uncharacterized protein n=1 Tax=Nannochloropsis gaditana TaxID=72520 RepID=W7U8H5_9STRA|nr:hypothetical protein Naga_100007g74 [Nannochloropsis gaditana]